MRRNLILALIIAGILIGDFALGAEAEKAPDAREWVEQLDRSKLAGLKAPTTVLILEKFSRDDSSKGSLAALEYKSDTCLEVSFVKCVNGSDFAYALKINKMPQAVKETDLARVGDARAVIYPDGDKVKLVDGFSGQSVELNRFSRLSRTLDARRLFDRMFYSLGYDGVVLDTRGSFILVGTLDIRLRKKDLQGLLIKDSGNSMIVNSEKSREGAALIALINHYGGYAVFKSIIGSDDVKLGQKVIIEGSR